MSIRKSPYNSGPLGIGIVYVLIYIPQVWFVKIGYTGNSVSSRSRSVSRSVAGFTLPIAFAVVPFAWHVEQALHFLFGLVRMSFYRGDGKSETFLLGHPAAVVMWAITYIQLKSIQWAISYI